MFHQQLFIAFDTHSGHQPQLDWDIELSALSCGLNLPDWFEDRMTTSLATLVMLSFNEANPIKIDLNELAKAEEDEAATKVQAGWRGRAGRSRARDTQSPRQARIESVSRKVELMMATLKDLQSELAKLKEA